MKNIVTTLIVILLTITIHAQHTISGTFSPAKDYTWLIAYRLKPGTQVYVADTSIKEGKFTLTMPKEAKAGSYRIVYAVPQEEFYFNVIYDGKENIELSFNPTNGVSFIKSKENILLTKYYTDIDEAKQKIIDFYVNGQTNKNAYNTIIKDIENIQEQYETASLNLISNHFIRANKPSIPSKYSTIQEYIEHKKLNYFNYIDFKDTTLLSSGFISDKVTNYAFTSLPLEQLTAAQTEAEVIKNIKKTDYYSLGCSNIFRFHIYYTLWSQAVANGMDTVSDYVYHNFLKDLAKETNNLEIINTIEIHNRLRIGTTAPEIVWNKNSLHTIKDAAIKNYILVFWSSTCSHCLKEVPKLHKYLKDNTNTKIIAVGLEDDEITWKQEIKRLPNFTHVISLEKWDSTYAKLYNIQATPTYFVLDKDKKIVSKPESYEELIDFLEKR